MGVARGHPRGRECDDPRWFARPPRPGLGIEHRHPTARERHALPHGEGRVARLDTLGLTLREAHLRWVLADSRALAMTGMNG